VVVLDDGPSGVKNVPEAVHIGSKRIVYSPAPEFDGGEERSANLAVVAAAGGGTFSGSS
jgi:hypothetical protein